MWTSEDTCLDIIKMRKIPYACMHACKLILGRSACVHAHACSHILNTCQFLLVFLHLQVVHAARC